MNTNRKKVIIATFLCAMIGFVACSDKEDVATKEIKTTSANVCIATHNARSGETTLNFTADRFRSEFERILRDSLRMDVSVEKVQIEDANPTILNYTGCLLISFFDINEETTSTLAFSLDKESDRNGNTNYFYCKEKIKHTIQCKANNNCVTNECTPVFENGKPVGCTPCEKGDCTKTITAAQQDHESILKQLGQLVSIVVGIISIF